MKRRTVIKTALAASVFHIVPRHVLGGAGHVPPSEKKHIALIGAGGRGRRVLRGMLQEPDVRAIAVADPAREFSLQDFYYRDVGGRIPTQELIQEHYAAEAGFRCAGYEDFEQMLSEERDLDAVICATPDHLHAYVSAKCLMAGKHVYCEKPLTHNISEARQLAELAKQSGLSTQMGNQGHSSDGIRETCEAIWAGAIGEVQHIDAWVSGHRWNPKLVTKPTTADSPPEGLNWDLWLGPRAERKFESAYFPVAWRDFWAFGNSNIGDFGCHDLDAACWALDLQAPSKIDFRPAGPCDAEIGPHGCVGYYQFDSSRQGGPVTINWYDGGLRPPVPAEWPAGSPLPSRGILFRGSEGILFCGGAGGKPRLLPESRQADFEAPTPTIPRVKSHARDWLDAMGGQSSPGSNFGYGARLTEIALLGALSMRTQQSIDWDAERMQATNAAASKIVQEPRRAGWEIG